MFHKVKHILNLFNSHPHKEDDMSADEWLKETLEFSTHILTRRMTEESIMVGQITGFSTHILTRRMTWMQIHTMQTRTFQLTSSQGG